MTSTSTASAMSSRAHSHAVPPARFASPVASASATASFLPAWMMRSSGQLSLAFAFWIPRTVAGAASADGPLGTFARQTAPSRLETTLWLLAVTPTRFPSASRSRIIRAPVYVLPLPGGPCTGSTERSSPGAIRRTASSGASPSATRLDSAGGIVAVSPPSDSVPRRVAGRTRGGTRRNRSIAARRGLSGAKRLDTTSCASRSRLSCNTLLLTASSGTSAAGWGTGDFRPRFRSIVRAASSSASTVPQNPRCRSSDSAVSGFFGESPTAISWVCSGKR